MDSKMMLFSEICRATGSSSADKVLDILSRYNISTNDKNCGFSECIDIFLKAKMVDGFSQKSERNYRLVLLQTDAFLGKAPYNITTNDIRGYIIHLENERKIKPASVTTYINILKSFFSWLLTEELIEKNPMNKISHKSSSKQSALRKFLTIEEVEHMRNACVKNRDKALVEMFLSTGCRLSEIATIKQDDIDFKTRSITVMGKGSKVRTVYFSARAQIFLQKYLEESGHKHYLFASTRKPLAPLGISCIQKTVRSIGEKAGLQGVHPHTLRHTFATSALNGGMDIGVIQKILGHNSIDTTQIYAQTLQSHIKFAYDRLTF